MLEALETRVLASLTNRVLKHSIYGGDGYSGSHAPGPRMSQALILTGMYVKNELLI